MTNPRIDRRDTMKKDAIVFLAIFAGLAFTRPTVADDSLLEAKRVIANRALAGRIAAEAARKRLENASVTLGTWHRIGPFRDQGPLINWMDNVDSSYKTVFDPEKDALAADGQPRLNKKYNAPNFPATPRAAHSRRNSATTTSPAALAASSSSPRRLFGPWQTASNKRGN